MSDDLSAMPSSLDREAYAWVMRFAAGEASPADIEALKQWCAGEPARAEAFDRVSRTWRELGPLGQELSAEGALSAHPDDPSHAIVHAPASIGRRAFLGGALAASAAGVTILAAVHPPLELWPSWSELAADYRTRTGEQRRVMLADNTSIEMNTQTSIDLRSAGEERGRIELITGEAMISAPPKASGTLTVLAANGRIVATDAQFNVRYQGDAVCVTCVAGDVSVELRAAIVRLPAGQQIVYSDKGISPAVAVDAAVVAAWQNGIVIFKSTPLSEVVAEVNRYRSGKVILTNEALGRRLFNARLRIADIDRVVSQIEQAFGAKATTLPGGIVLLS
jgi:transmembrane sensor